LELDVPYFEDRVSGTGEVGKMVEECRVQGLLGGFQKVAVDGAGWKSEAESEFAAGGM
jgi:hypothetical protein